MLRIYIHDQVPVTSFVLEGKLVGPLVKELEKYWSALATDASRTMLVDLANVSFIDSEGRALLARMRRKGARLPFLTELERTSMVQSKVPDNLRDFD